MGFDLRVAAADALGQGGIVPHQNLPVNAGRGAQWENRRKGGRLH